MLYPVQKDVRNRRDLSGIWDFEIDPDEIGERDGWVDGLPEERCRRVNLGYADYRTIDPEEWAGREAEDILLVPHAGEVLYRAESLSRVKEPV